MGELLVGLSERLSSQGAVTLTDEERAVVAAAIRALGEAEQRIALQSRLLESHGDDAAEIAGLLSVAGADAFERRDGVDLAAHERAREVLRDRLEGASAGAEWIGAVLDFVRLVAL